MPEQSLDEAEVKTSPRVLKREAFLARTTENIARTFVETARADIIGATIKGRTMSEWYDYCCPEINEELTPAELISFNAILGNRMTEIAQYLAMAKQLERYLSAYLGKSRRVKTSALSDSLQKENKRLAFDKIQARVDVELTDNANSLALARSETSFWVDLYAHLKTLGERVKQQSILILGEFKHNGGLV